MARSVAGRRQSAARRSGSQPARGETRLAGLMDALTYMATANTLLGAVVSGAYP
ncbi:MAG: hypothetical protein JSR49_00925 [Proteobacteria bacterium]|nr:hypothetical protein [Pseudomonadota bacterium]